MRELRYYAFFNRLESLIPEWVGLALAPMFVGVWLDHGSLFLGFALWLVLASSAFLPQLLSFLVPVFLSNQKLFDLWVEHADLFKGDYFAAEGIVVELLERVTPLLEARLERIVEPALEENSVQSQQPS